MNFDRADAIPSRPALDRVNCMNGIKRCYAFAILSVLGAGALVVPASAAPPTVTPSPGYDARLQEQRAAPPIYQRAAPAPKPVVRRHRKPVHDTR
jgi:hypothetical protein